MRGREALDRLAELTRRQRGLVTRAPAAAIGTGDRALVGLVRAGELERIACEGSSTPCGGAGGRW